MEDAPPLPQSVSISPTDGEQSIFRGDEMCIAQLWTDASGAPEAELKDMTEWAALQARFRETSLPKEVLRGWIREYLELSQQSSGVEEFTADCSAIDQSHWVRRSVRGRCPETTDRDRSDGGSIIDLDFCVSRAR